MNQPLEKWQVNVGKRVIKLLRKHCHPGRELQLLVNLVNYHFLHTDAELDMASWHPPYHIKHSVEHDGWKCVQFLLQCPYFIPGQIYQKLKIVCKNQNAMRMAYSRLGDSPRWCRGHEGLDHRWSPSWETGREFCTKCGEPRYPDLPFVKFGAPAVELLPPALGVQPENVIVEPKRTWSVESRFRNNLSDALDRLAKVNPERPRTFGVINDPSIRWDPASPEPDVTVPELPKTEISWTPEQLKQIVEDYGPEALDVIPRVQCISYEEFAKLQKERDNLQAEVKQLQAVIERLEDEKPRSNY